MWRAYDYRGYSIEVSTEIAFTSPQRNRTASLTGGAVAILRVCRAGPTVAYFAPLPLSDGSGQPFQTEPDALMSGFSAGRRIVDDLLGDDRGDGGHPPSSN